MKKTVILFGLMCVFLVCAGSECDNIDTASSSLDSIYVYATVLDESGSVVLLQKILDGEIEQATLNISFHARIDRKHRPA